MIDSLLFAAVRIVTFQQAEGLTNATGFFFRAHDRLYLVTSRHVLVDEPTGHYPDRIEIELHTSATNLALSTGYSIPLYHDGTSVWTQGTDSAGEIDVAAIEIDTAQFPASAVYRAFDPRSLPLQEDIVEVGTPMLVVGFPLGFQDTLHHLPVVRHAVVASSYGLRFQGEGYFLTDARTHRGTSGAPVVMRDVSDAGSGENDLPWKLLGIHSSRMDLGTRDLVLDEALGLNCAWYADILLTLTRD